MNWLRRLLPTRTSRPIAARYDAAQTTPGNRRHWGQADNLAADASLSPAVRRTLRNRARYEAANGSYLAGMVSTLCTDLVGTGPRLLLDAGPDADQDRVRQVEQAVAEWALAIDLAGKLRIYRHARAIDGEAFGILITNPKLSGVQLDLRLVEADQITDPTPTIDPQIVDGIRIDAAGNPSAYHVLRYHPGAVAYGWTLEGDWIAAGDVCHWYHATRPGQHRGVPEITPALELFAMLRRYTLAVVTSAETAANIAAIIHTTAPGSDRGSADVDAWETVPMARGTIMSVPEGWTATQMKAEQPTATFDTFQRTLLNEIARCLNLPFNVAALNSSSYNYSSGRMDYQIYHAHRRTLRADLERVVLDPLLSKWLDEAALVPGLIPDGLPPVARWTWSWTWDGSPDVDPVKEAEADGLRLEQNTTTLAKICSRTGEDWRAVLRQRAAERQAARDLGLIDAAPAPLPAAPDPAAAAAPATDELLELEDLELEDLEADDLEAATSYRAPAGARDEAARGLAWRQEFNRGGTSIGVARARDLVNNRPLSESTVRRMASYFARHEVDKQGQGWSPGEAGYPSAGRIAWALWGGDPARTWANRLVTKLDREEATA